MTSSTTNYTSGDPLSGHRPEFSASWIENWPQAVAAMSFRQVGVKLTTNQVHAIGRGNGVDRHCFKEGQDESLIELARTLNEAFAGFPDGAFVRLGSRSPKDTPLGVITGCRAMNGFEALRLLTAGSRRMAFDLRRSLRAGYQPWIFLREWQEPDWSSEFRCFLFDGRFGGASQYHYRVALPEHKRSQLVRRACNAISAFVPLFQSAWGSRDIVFDICITREAENTAQATLIELNPAGSPTDPCLFSWQEHDFDGCLRITTEFGKRSMS